MKTKKLRKLALSLLLEMKSLDNVKVERSLSNPYREYDADYDELAGLSEQEVIDYLNENGYDFCLKDSKQECIADEFRFEKEIVREKTYDEEQTFFIAE